jgi:hypothetical protein
MKTSSPFVVPSLLLSLLVFSAKAATTFTLNPFISFGPNGDGSIKPGQSIGFSPLTGNEVDISAPTNDLTGGLSSPNLPYGFGWQPGDSTATPNSTVGFNMRGLAFDPVTKHLIFVDTHTGSGGAQTNPPNAAVYILDGDSGQIISTLTASYTNLNSAGVTNDGSGVGVFAVAGVADDGVVYVCGQINANAGAHFKIWRWPTADTNSPGFIQIPTLAASIVPSPLERIGQTMAVRGSGTNTLIIAGTSSLGGSGTNVYLFTTTDGTNFSPHRLFFNGITTPQFNDGIAFGPGNTFFTKQVGQPLNFLAWDTSTFVGSVIASYTAKSASDPLLNLSGIAFDPTNHLLAGLEEIGGNATSGNGKVWLYDVPDPTNHAPAILATRVYTVNFQKTTAPMGYLAFGNGRLYAHASNNGFLCSKVDSVSLSPPTYTWTDYKTDGSAYTRVNDLPPITRAVAGQGAHFEVFAVPDVTNYQWFSNSVPIPGATGYSLDIANLTTNASGSVIQAVAYNAAGSSNSVASTLQVVSTANFFHLNLLWSVTANTMALSNPTNFITSNGGSATPNERTIAYNALSNQLLVVRGPKTLASLKVFVINSPERFVTNSTYPTGFPTNIYTLNTTAIETNNTLVLCGVGVADDGAVYAAAASSSTPGDDSFKIYRWANTDPATVPVEIFGTNSSAMSGNPMADPLGSSTFRFGDNLAVRGAGTGTEIIVDAQNNTKYFSILTPTDATMTNWVSKGYLLQNTPGSYGYQIYGTSIGRSLQFGPSSGVFWQKRYSASGAPLTQMTYTPGSPAGSLALLGLANTSLPIYTNGPVALNFSLNVAAAVNFAGGGVGNNLSSPDTLSYYDITDPSQAVLLGTANLPGPNVGGHQANGNAIAQVVFGVNPTTGTNYIFVLDANNGVQAYTLAGGVSPPPRFLTQPKNLRLLLGSSGSMEVTLDQSATVFWYKGTNPPVYTGVQANGITIANAQASTAGDYFAVATNLNGAVTSQVAHVSIGLAQDNYTLAQAWAATPASGYYVTSDGGANTPKERAFALNTLSNQLIIVQCPFSSTAYALSVVDASSGALLYTLNTSGVIHESGSEVSGSNPIDLVGAAASDDGSVYICNETPNASGGAFGDTTKMFTVYRWANSSPSTAPVIVWQGDPSGQPAGVNERWGDVLTVRGGGTNTELFLDSQDGVYGAVLKPVDSSLNSFTNFWFIGSAGSGSIGRSVQFGDTNTVLQKRWSSSLVLSKYDTNAQSSVALSSVDSSGTLGGVWVDRQHNLAVGVDFIGTVGSVPDAVALYDISDPASPMLLGHYNFPVNKVANGNVICQTIVSGSKVYSLDGNNGLVSFWINPPASSMTLNAVRSGANLNLSWGNSSAILQGSPAVAPATWTDLTTAGQTNSVQSLAGPNHYFRLILRR